MWGEIKIGDGTAPKGFPAYSSWGIGGVRCNFKGCGHTGHNGHPCVMDCGKGCSCPCCQMLQGKKVFGCTYG